METLTSSPLLEALTPAIILSIIAPLVLALIVLLRIHLRSRYVVNWPIVGMLPSIVANTHRLHSFITDMVRDGDGSFHFKGPWFSGMDFLLIGDPVNANHIANINFSNYPKGDEFQEIFDILGDGIFVADADSWRTQRKMARSIVSCPGFRNSVPTSTQHKVERSLIPLLDRMAEAGEPFDIQDVFLRFTNDTTCTLVFGVDPGCLEANDKASAIPFAKAMDEVEEVLLFRHIVPMFWWKLLRWMNIGAEKKMVGAWEEVDRFISKVITERRERTAHETGGGEASSDLLTSYMTQQEEEGSSPLTKSDQFLRDTMLTFLSAGKDTIGSALTWFFWLISTNRHVEEKILEELRENKVNADFELGKLVYLHAALCETLRLYPPVPFNHKKSLRPDVLPSGHRVGENMMILTSVYAMGRLERVWGKDCMEFMPERWFSEEGKLKHEPTSKFFTFNAGPRTCLGKDMAFTQLKIVASKLIERFQIDVVEGHKVEPKLSVILYMENGLMVKLRKRSEV